MNSSPASTALLAISSSSAASTRVVLTISLVLPEDAALVSGLSFSAEGTYDGELDGAGKVYVSKLSVAGGTLHALEGDVELRGTRMFVPSASGRLFDGWTESRFEVGLLEENSPVSLKVEMTGLDLAVLTEDLLSVSEERIPEIRSLLTITAGRIVHGDGPFAGFAPELPPLKPEWSPVRQFGGFARHE